MKESLYDMSKELVQIESGAIDENGEINVDLEQKLNEVQAEFKEKVHGIVSWTMNIESKEEALDREIARLQRRKKIAESLRKRLQEYVKWALETTGRKKLEFDAFTIFVSPNPPSVEVTDEKAIPSQYMRIRQIIEIDKQGILRALKAGEEVSGTKLIEDRTHLRIR